MGQTLTHGIYLPDEGERNCYNGLAANWQILDTSVGTIAAHTAALAGKAPLVHTHVKADITDFPAYGNAAGTICEGNDSRLSDARTPVAHTHGKADITDLFNSANTWTGDNSFSKTLNIYNSDSAGTTPALYLKSSKSVIGTMSGSETDIQKIAVLDKNGNTVSENTTYVYSAGSSWVMNAVYTTDDSDNVISSQISHYIYKNGRRVLRPDTDTDLGTSANQWNNLYAKNYYYNGTAWGLDKANEWKNTNFFTLNLHQKGFSSRAAIPASNEFGNLNVSDNVNAPLFSINYANRTSGERDISFRVYNTSGNTNGAMLRKDASNNYSLCSIDPNNTISLGTSTNKWKSLNGINPGALSIFNPSAIPDPISFPNGVNESGTWKYDGSAWNALDVSNIGDGWIIITYNACAVGDYILARFGGTGGSRYPSMLFKAEILAGSPTSAFVYAFFPVAKAFGNIYLEMKINSNANLVLHHFMPAYGTV